MRTSVVIASHNEGDLLWRTVGSCLETTRGLDCEIVVADDASTDGCVEEMLRRFPHVRVVRFAERRGVSATKDLAARSSSGDTLIILDAHCKPERGAISRLASDIDRGGESSIVSPLIVQLDAARWKCDPSYAGYGFWVDLRTLNNGWHARAQLKRVSGPGGRKFYEQPCVVGCCMAMSRKVYEHLRGFDIGMRSYGSEDIDFGLRAWQLGYSLLCDPQAVIGHRFQAAHRGYSVPHEHCLYNELRMARKNLGDRPWIEWLQRHQKRADSQVWAAAWELFEQDRRSVELERDFLLANRVRDEYQYARQFGLRWPSPSLRRLAPVSPILAAGSISITESDLTSRALDLARIKSGGQIRPPTKQPEQERSDKKPIEPTKTPPPGRLPHPTKQPVGQPTKSPTPAPTHRPTKTPRKPTRRPKPTKQPRRPTKRPPKGPTRPTKRPPKGPPRPTKRPPKGHPKGPKGPKRPKRPGR